MFEGNKVGALACRSPSGLLGIIEPQAILGGPIDIGLKREAIGEGCRSLSLHPPLVSPLTSRPLVFSFLKKSCRVPIFGAWTTRSRKKPFCGEDGPAGWERWRRLMLGLWGDCLSEMLCHGGATIVAP